MAKRKAQPPKAKKQPTKKPAEKPAKNKGATAGKSGAPATTPRAAATPPSDRAVSVARSKDKQQEKRNVIQRFIDDLQGLIHHKKDTEIIVFRRYKKYEGGTNKKARHPKLIIEVTDEDYKFMGLTESPKSGHKKNIPLTNNPKKGDKRQAYIRKELRQDKQNNFYEIREDYELSDEDLDKIIEYLKYKKKK